jgi:hypothetical protein
MPGHSPVCVYLQLACFLPLLVRPRLRTGHLLPVVTNPLALVNNRRVRSMRFQRTGH